jgi:thioredoxin-like negative regulator of GroEL
MRLIKVSTDNFDNIVTTGNVYIFYTAQWSTMSASITDILEDISSDTEDTIGMLNIDLNPIVMKHEDISVIPTLVHYIDGIEESRIIGAKSYDTYSDYILSDNK